MSIWDKNSCTENGCETDPPYECKCPPPTVDEVCIIPGAGRGECWGCPVAACVLWQNPANPLSEATETAALRAAHKLASRAKVIQPATADAQENLVETAAALALLVTEPEVQYRLTVDMAAESIIQDLNHADTVKRRNQYTDRWLKGLHGRLPTSNDDMELDALMDRADADVASEHYSVKSDDVLVRIRWFRNRKIVRLDRDVQE